MTLFHGKELFYIGLPYMPYRMPYRMPYLFARIALIFNGLPYMSHTNPRARTRIRARARMYASDIFNRAYRTYRADI